MHPAVIRFCAAVGRRVLIWIAVVVIIKLITRYVLQHQ